jgi:elongation factor 2
MIDFETATIHELTSNQKNIRNLCVIAPVGDGGNTITDRLIQAYIASKGSITGRYIDSRVDEQNPNKDVSLYFNLNKNVLESHFNEGETSGTDFLINIVNFSSEVSANGALVAVNLENGISVQTETLLTQAIDKRITLVFTDIDRAILKLKYTERELCDLLRKRIESFNAKLVSIGGLENCVKSLDPVENEISFCSDLLEWGFTLGKFVRFYIKMWNKNVEIEKKFAKHLGSFKHYCEGNDPFDENYSFKKFKDNIPDGKLFPFELYILKPIYQVKDFCMGGQIDNIKDYLSKFDININPDELPSSGEELFNKVMQKWLPGAECLLEQIVLTLPNPGNNQT